MLTRAGDLRRRPACTCPHRAGERLRELQDFQGAAKVAEEAIAVAKVSTIAPTHFGRP